MCISKFSKPDMRNKEVLVAGTSISTSVEHYYVYSYEHLDDLTFIRPPEAVDEDAEFRQALCHLQADIKALLSCHGWEGDGDLGIMWLPPFVDVGVEDTWGTYVWVVKQYNNGTSFIASPFELPFNRLHRQNRDHMVWDGMVPEGILRVSREGLAEQLDEIVPALEQDLVAIAALPVGSTVATHLFWSAPKGIWSQHSLAYLDDCYLRILIEVISDGNKSGLKLRKSRANLNPGNYLPDDFEGDVDGFFTLNGVISDMWATYKFEPFTLKLDMLLKPVGFAAEDSIVFELRKHVAMRNAVQHHEGWVSTQLLRDLGRSSIPVATATGAGQLEARTRIVFTVEEIRAFDRTLRRFAADLDEHVEARVASRAYSKPPADGGSG